MGGRDVTHQQHTHSHHGRRSSGNGAVHQNHMILADVFGQAQVVKLGGGRKRMVKRLLLWRQREEEETLVTTEMW